MCRPAVLNAGRMSGVRAKTTGKAPASLQVPWFRVLRSSGELAFPKGSEIAQKQARLLEQEQVQVRNNRVNLKTYGWKPDLTEILVKLQF